MKKSHIIGLILIYIVIFSVFSLIVYGNLTKGEINVHFDDKVIDSLNEIYVNTTSPWEFVAYLYGDQDNITRYGMIGYHNAVTNDISLTYDRIDFSEISIHSHPKINYLPGLCFLSNTDRSSIETVVCVMCGVDKIRCYIIN